jgi:hypothetical protein
MSRYLQAVYVRSKSPTAGEETASALPSKTSVPGSGFVIHSWGFGKPGFVVTESSLAS